jgi:hypothetical protein
VDEGTAAVSTAAVGAGVADPVSEQARLVMSNKEKRRNVFFMVVS